MYIWAAGAVDPLTDGFIHDDVLGNDASRKPAVWRRPHIKRERDQRFPLELIVCALLFAIGESKASEPKDLHAIFMYVRAHSGGETVVNATFRARFHIAVLPLLKGDKLKVVDVQAGFEALHRSMLTKLSRSQLPAVHAEPLIQALPCSVVELLLPGSGLTDEDTRANAAFLAASRLPARPANWLQPDWRRKRVRAR
ncbi:hypothetical protein KFE25_008952 [Diacronema lutheri]|uniref:Uncharacterized protein n=1 Tax=Diacronema lutheri TaxID=2081491 RepID=A0A8J5XJS3_DIALT|nr:hypothetical protein KFE25_008952 [Diacronema lutheri]